MAWFGLRKDAILLHTLYTVRTTVHEEGGESDVRYTYLLKVTDSGKRICESKQTLPQYGRAANPKTTILYVTVIYPWLNGDDIPLHAHITSRAAPQAQPGTRIAACAVKDTDGVIHSMPRPARHHTILNAHEGLAGCEQGFLTSDGSFATREGALEIARQAGQIVKRCGGDEDRLFSENLW